MSFLLLAMVFFSTAILSVIFTAGLDVTFTADRVAIFTAGFGFISTTGPGVIFTAGLTRYSLIRRYNDFIRHYEAL